MNSKAKIVSLALACLIFCVLSLACDMNHGTTPLAPAIVSYGGGLTFKPSSVTIKSGMEVIWDGSFGFFHTVNIDDGAGNCVTNYTSFPTTVSFASPGTYSYHCAYHSPCGPSTCGTACTGMAGVVVVK